MPSEYIINILSFVIEVYSETTKFKRLSSTFAAFGYLPYFISYTYSMLTYIIIDSSYDF